MSGKTTKEDREEKEARRREKRQAKLERHVVRCPHCGENALDHMTKCPHCGGELTPRGYRPPDEEKMKKVRTWCYIIGFAVFAVIVVFLVCMK